MEVDSPSAGALSAELRALALILGLVSHQGKALPLLLAARERVASLLQQLPAAFFQPLLPGGSVDQARMQGV